MNTPNEDRDLFQADYFDPFPQPQTIPSGWDLSGLFPTPVLESPDLANGLAESESDLNTHGDQ